MTNLQPAASLDTIPRAATDIFASGAYPPVRWGVLGCARVFERRMVPAFGALSRVARVVAVGSQTEGKAEALIAQSGAALADARAYGDYYSVLDDPRVEAVYIPLPNDQHAPWTLEALARGKHVLCEKPAALSESEATQMADAASARGLCLMEAFMFRHHPQHVRVRELIASGVIGRARRFRAVFAYPAPLNNRTGIRWNAAQGGGAFLDVGVYGVNAARFIFCDEPTHASGVSGGDTDGADVDTHTIATLAFSGGRTAVIEGGFDQHFTTRYEVAGDRGTITATRAFQVGERGVSLAIRVTDGAGGDTLHTEEFPHVDQYALQIAHFSACVRGVATLAPGENGVHQARAVCAVRRAVKERVTVEL